MVTRIYPRRPPKLYISEWISYRGLNQEQVADRMDCAPGTMSKLVKGHMKATVEWLARIADALDIEVQDLFHDPRKPTQQDLLRDVPAAEQERIIKAIRALTGTDN